MIFQVLVFFLYVTVCVTESFHEGDSCNLTNGRPGICTLLDQCPSVLDNLMEGNPPDVACGYSGFEPIICCPKSASESTTTPLPVEPADGRGEIARQKCAEYSRYVFTLKKSPISSPVQQYLNVSQCGIKSNIFIGNNRNAYRMEYPYMAAVGYDLKNGDIGWHCAGTLISETFVLTAAHCTNLEERGNAVWVRVGDINLKRSDNGALPVDRRVAERIRHPDFIPSLQYHDIALLRLEARVPFNAWIRPACLHTKPRTGTLRAIVTGWGQSEANDAGSRNVRMDIKTLVDPQTCNLNWTSGTINSMLPNGVVANWSVCAEAEDKDSCQSDAGGALVIYDKAQYCMYDIVGVVAQGKLCNGQNPGIYTRVYYYVRWIESIVWGQG